VQEPLARRMLPRADRREIAAIFAGGALGTLARAALAEAFPHPATAWPWPTFGVNIAAACLARPGEPGPARWQKLMVYTSEAVQHRGQPVHRAIVRRLHAAGISGATTQRGIWGFHGDHAPHGDRLLQLGRHVPAVTIVVDTQDRIATAFSVIDELTTERGLVTCETIPALRGGAGLVEDGPRIEALR